MKVKLIDLDSRMPNLALMQLSAYHKSIGDSVSFDESEPDKVYISCIFKNNAPQAYGLSVLYPGADVDLGGSGIDLTKQIPSEAQKVYPDYSLYPKMDYSLGFTTRGCIRKCPFCVVPIKEGHIHKWQHISEFYNPKFKNVYLLDNNMYAIKDWFFENTDFILEKNLRLCVPQGFDIRILDEEIAERLYLLKWSNRHINFAFDNMSDEKAVIKGIEILQQAGINTRNYVQFFVLTGFNTTFEQDLYRVNLLRSMNCGAFVMQYRKTALSRMLARYANRRHTYFSFPFEEYIPFRNYQRKCEVIE